MNLEDIPFGIYREISPNIIEVIANEGIELNAEMQQMAETALFEKFQGNPYCLLVNRINSYSHSFASMQKLPEFRNLVAIAIVVYSSIADKSAESHQDFQSNTQTFRDLPQALSWLKEMLKLKK